MNKRRAALFALAHFALWCLAIGFSFSRTMARFDTGAPGTHLDVVLDAAADVLSFPVVTLTLEVGGGRITFLLALLANSLIWGFAIEYVYQRLRLWGQSQT